MPVMPTTPVFSVEELKRYSRQLFLPEIEFSGQCKLKQARVLILGLGGLGSVTAMYLASSGVGSLTLCDFDEVELSNLQRQIVHNSQRLGMNKAISAAKTLESLNPHVNLQTITHHLTEQTLFETIASHDLVLDCTDNFRSRYQINAACVAHKKILVSASVIGFHGQVSSFHFADSNQEGCYQCLFPYADEANLEQQNNCSTFGVLASAVGVMGSIQATEAIKAIVGLPTLINQLLLLDTRNWQQRIIRLKRDVNCPACQ